MPEQNRCCGTCQWWRSEPTQGGLPIHAFGSCEHAIVNVLRGMSVDSNPLPSSCEVVVYKMTPAGGDNCQCWRERKDGE